MTFEFMHFVQARIATIDTYVVFFIILMYYFMLVYLSIPYSLRKPEDFLLPLFLWSFLRVRSVSEMDGYLCRVGWQCSLLTW